MLTHGPAIRSTSSYLDPLPLRLPKEGVHHPRPSLERSQSELRTYDYGSLLAHPSSVATASPGQLRRDGLIEKVYSFNDVWESQKGSFRGMGKHIMSVNATPEDQMNHLHRTMSDLTPRMVDQLGDFDTSGIDPTVWHRWRKSRTESTASSASSQSIGNLISHREYPDCKRAVTVTKGFAPALISPSSFSSADEASSHHRKDSTVSMTSISSDGKTLQRRRKSRHTSLPVSEKSANSPLTTITENPDALEKPQEKNERPCKFDEAGNKDSAIVSSASSDENMWMTTCRTPEKDSQLTKQHERSWKSQAAVQHLTRPRTHSGEPTKPRQVGKPLVERSRTVKHIVRPAMRRAHSPKRAKGKPAVIRTPKVPVAQAQNVENEVTDTEAASTVSIPCQDAADTTVTSDEAGENPTDLNQFMEKARSKHSSKGPRSKHCEGLDDAASMSSSSTAKTLVPMVKKMVDALPIHRRQRSATAFRVTPTMCRPPNKAEGARAEASQATAR